MFIAEVCEIEEGRGLRVRVLKGEVFTVFRRQHPLKETNKGAAVSVREYLTKIGVKP